MVTRDWLPKRILALWQGLLVGVALALLATGLRLAVEGLVGREFAFMAYLPALLVAAAVGGMAGGLACLAAATLAAFVSRPATAPLAAVLAALWVFGGVTVAATAALAARVRELRHSEAALAETRAQLQTLVGELAHRSRNALAVVMSIVSQSARSAQSADEAERVINARLQALLRAQEVVVLGAKGGTAALRALVQTSLEPFGLDRFTINPAGDIELDADVATGLGLVFHELATNAVKHGALSSPDGRVSIGWNVDADLAQFTWREVGGPAVEPPSKRGFGSRLLDIALVPQGGRVERQFERQGLVCTLEIPSASRGDRSSVLPGSVFASQAAEDD